MAAGLGFKTFTTGEVLTAADTNGYLMQGVLVFASATARDAAITSPQEGQYAYLKDTNVTYYYSGSAWVSTAGAASPLTTKGDLYTYSTADARLAVGTNGQVLQADSTAPTGLAWATASGAISNYSLISTTNPSATTTVNLTGLSGKNKYFLQCSSLQLTSAGTMLIRFNSDSGAHYSLVGSTAATGGSVSRINTLTETAIYSAPTFAVPTGDFSTLSIFMDGCNSTGSTFYQVVGNAVGASTTLSTFYGTWTNSAAITSINITSTVNFNASSTFKLYGSVN